MASRRYIIARTATAGQFVGLQNALRTWCLVDRRRSNARRLSANRVSDPVPASRIRFRDYSGDRDEHGSVILFSRMRFDADIPQAANAPGQFPATKQATTRGKRIASQKLHVRAVAWCLIRTGKQTRLSPFKY